MEDNKEKNFSEETKEEKDIVMEETEDKKEMSEDKKPEEKEEEKEMACGEEKEMSDDSEKEKREIEEKEEEDIADEEKKFSLNAYIDQTAMLAMLETETEEYKELAEKVTKEFSANEIVSKFIEMAKENAELKADKQRNDEEKKDKKFSAIMASVKEDLDEESYSKLVEEGKQLSLEQLGAFENKVKAFAYEATKKKVAEEDNVEIMRFGNSNNESEIENDVFARISKM